MDVVKLLEQGLLAYLLFIPLLTFHEWAHAWTAWKCGDDTAHRLGRVSLNPIVHMELIGTVVLPLLGILSGTLGWGFVVIGWGKPVPVNPNNLKHPRLQDSFIAMAGPAINLVLAALLLGIAKIAAIVGQPEVVEIIAKTAELSLFLCFFNLIPIPPLDGSHLLLNLTRMSYETYYRFARIGFVLIIILFQFGPVRLFLLRTVDFVFRVLARSVGLDFY